MPDLDAAIRERIDRWCSDDECTANCPRAALLAVLELHPAEAHECPGVDPAWGQVTDYEPTCATRLAIAKALDVLPE